MSEPIQPKLERRGQRSRWRKVEQARELLNKRSKDILQAMIDKALAGDVKAGKWLLEHTATTDQQGQEQRPIAAGIDRQIQPTHATDSSPRIMIGVSLGADFARLNTPSVSQIVTTPSPARQITSVIDSDHVLTSQADTDDSID